MHRPSNAAGPFATGCWYPTMRLFRQSAPNDWAGVVREVRREVEVRLAQPAGAKQRA